MKEWKVAWRSELVLLYTLFLPLYRLLQMSVNQDCSCSMRVIHTADLCAMIQCVRWGNTTQAGIDARTPRRAETVLCCDYYCHYCTIISLICAIIGIIAEKEFANRFGIHWKRESKGIRSHRGLVFAATRTVQKQNRLSRGAPTCLTAPAGRLGWGRRPGSWRAWQGETDHPRHQQFGQLLPFCPATWSAIPTCRSWRTWKWFV